MNRRILVLEDDVDIANNLKELLESDGYAVDIASDGEKALSLLRKSAVLPALIFLDLMMPGVDGYHFRRLQEQDARLAHIPVVVISADGPTEEKRFRIGAREFIRKPVDIDHVLKTARKYCAMRA